MTAAVQKMMPSAVLASCVCSRKIWSTGKIEPHGGGRENLQAPASPSGYTCAREVHVPEIARPTPCDDRASTGKTGPPVGRARIYGPLMAVPSPPDTRARKSRLLGLRAPVTDPYGNPLTDPYGNPLR